MNFQLKSRHIDGLEDLETQINKKLERFKHILPENSYVELELKQFSKAQGNGDKEAEIIADLPGTSRVIRFVAQAPSFLEAVDIVLDKLDSEATQEKARKTDHSLHHQPPIKEVVADMSRKVEF